MILRNWCWNIFWNIFGISAPFKQQTSARLGLTDLSHGRHLKAGAWQDLAVQNGLPKMQFIACPLGIAA